MRVTYLPIVSPLEWIRLHRISERCLSVPRLEAEYRALWRWEGFSFTDMCAVKFLGLSFAFEPSRPWLGGGHRGQWYGRGGMARPAASVVKRQSEFAFG